MLKSEAAAIIAGVKRTEGAQASNAASLSVMTGDVIERSEDGICTVVLDGLVYSEDEEQYIEIEGLGGLEEGDTATILLTGEPGRGKTLLALGSVGSIDRIDVRIREIEADYIKTENLEATNARIETLETDSVEVSNTLVAYQGRIETLEADHVTIADLSAVAANVETLQATKAYVDALVAGNVSAQDIIADTAKVHSLTAAQISAATGFIGTLAANNVTANNIIADHGDFASVKANAAKVQNLTAAQIEADHATVAALDTNYAQIDMANVNNAWINNGVIKDGSIVNSMIDSVSANKLTAGTIDASNITVTNLNASNITTGTINGQRIGEGSLSLSKLEDDVYTESEVDALLSDMQAEIDGAIETWTGTAVPTLQNAPASNWTTNSEKDRHVGDVYFVVNSQSQQNGYNYRFTKTGNAYSWQLIKDNDVTNALARLEAAEGSITQFDVDINDSSTGLKSRTTTLEGTIVNKADSSDVYTKTDADSLLALKVSTSDFNDLSDTVDGHGQTITSLSTQSEITATAATEYVAGTQTAQTNLWTGRTKSAALTAGKSILYRLPYAGNSSAATLNLTLSGGGTTGAKSIQQAYNTGSNTATLQNVTNHWPAGSIIPMTYDGTKWVVQNYNTNVNQVDRTLHNNYIKAESAITSGRIICGNASGYKNIGANVEFDLSYPIMYASANIAANGQGTAYEIVPSINPSNNGTIQGLAVDKTLYLKGTVTGNTFKIAASNFLTCTVPTSEDNFYYIPLGIIAHDATTKMFFVTSKQLHAYVGNAFMQVQALSITTSTKVNQVSDTVDGHAQRIGSLETTVETKADNSTVTTISNRVNTISDTVDGHTSSISNLTNTVATKADGTTVTALQEDYADFKQTVESFESTVGTTYATKTEVGAINTRVTEAETNITQNTNDISLRATKTEVYQTAKPNLSPFFSSSPYSTSNDYWLQWPNTAGFTFTDMGEGWIRARKSATSSQVRHDIRMLKSGTIEPGKNYTFLFEFRNNACSGANTTCYVVQNNNNQFWGGNIVKNLEGKNPTSTTTGLLNDFVPGTPGVYTKRFVKKSETAANGHWTDGDYSNVTALACLVWLVPANGVLDVEWRVSVYEDEYTGPYKPYVGDQLYASQAELKVTNNNVSSKVSSTDYNGNTINSLINQDATTVKIAASKVQIDGTAIFNAISDDIDDAITDKGYATTTQAQGYANTAKSEAISAAATDATSKANTAKSEAISAAATDATSKANIAINAAATDATSKANAVQANLDTVKSSMVWEGICSTAAGTAAKVVDCAGFSSTDLVEGARIRVRFKASSTFGGAITLNINSTGEKIVYCGGATTSATNMLLIAAGADIDFTYTGSVWRIANQPGSYYSTCATAAATAAKTAGYNGAWVCKGSSINILMTYENTSTSATLNVESTGARAIYYGNTTTRPTTANNYGWKAGDIAHFIFDGQFWRYGDATLVSDTRAAQSTANGAIKRTQRIYYQSNSTTAPATPGTASSNWVTSTSSSNGVWTLKRMSYSSDYPYIWTCEQKETNAGEVSYTTVLLDDTTTVIDGGKIITGTVAANKLSVYDATIQKIRADAIDASGLTIGYSQIDNPPSIPSKTSDLTNDSNYTTTSDVSDAIVNSQVGRNLAYGLKVVNTPTAYAAQQFALSENLIKGEKYTIQFFGVTISRSDKTTPWIGLYWGGGAVALSSGSTLIPDENGYCKLTFTAPNNSHADTNKPLLVCYNSPGQGASGTTYNLYIEKIKIEKGERATEWTPAPEDSISWYAECTTAAGTAAKVATIKPDTDRFRLVVGVSVDVKFSVTNTYSTLGSLSLNVNDTGAKQIRTQRNNAISNIAHAGILYANVILRCVYNGTNWLIDENYNENNIDRRQHNNQVKAAANLDRYSICAGTSAGYRTITAGMTFDLDYPVLYLYQNNATNQTYAVASGGTTNNMYEAIPGVNLNYTVADILGTLTPNKTVYLKGTVSGNSFTVASSPFFTTSVPVSEDGFVYMPIGLNGSNASSTTAALFFATSRDLYTYKDGLFGPVSIREASAAAKTATNYITADSNGIKIHMAGTSTTYQHQTATGTTFYVNGNKRSDVGAGGLNVYIGDAGSEVSVAEFGTTARIGKTTGQHIVVDSDSVDLKNGNATLASFEAVTNEPIYQGEGSRLTLAGLDVVIEGTKNASENRSVLGLASCGSGPSSLYLRAYKTSSNVYPIIKLDDNGSTSSIVAGFTGGTEPTSISYNKSGELRADIDSAEFINGTNDGKLSFEPATGTANFYRTGVGTTTINADCIDINADGPYRIKVDSGSAQLEIDGDTSSVKIGPSSSGITGVRISDVNFSSGTDTNVSLGVGTNHVNHGVYSNTYNNWLVHSDGSSVYLGGRCFSRGSVGQTNSVAANNYKDVSVTFGHTYSSAPTVIVGLNSSSTAGAIGECSVSVASVSTTGFTARLFNAGTTARSPGFYWIALG